MAPLSTTAYFGYGANASPQLMDVLLGRKPRGTRAVLNHFRLYIEPWHIIPLAAQATLVASWRPGSFNRYVIRPRRGHSVEGMLWELTPQEKRILEEWDMSDGRWMHTQKVVVKTSDDVEVVAETEVRPLWHDELTIPTEFSLFLNDRTRMLQTADYVRRLVRF